MLRPGFINLAKKHRLAGLDMSGFNDMLRFGSSFFWVLQIDVDVSEAVVVTDSVTP